jgi:hypothetical protein
MRTNILTATAALSLAATVLTACGSSGGGGGSSASGDYCSELKADKTYFAGLEGNSSATSLDEMFQRMHTLADDSPDAVASDWKTLDNAITMIENALKDAGLKPSDLTALQNGQVPAGVDMSKLQALAPKMQALSSGAVSDAANRITQNAKDTCGVDLNAS